MVRKITCSWMSAESGSCNLRLPADVSKYILSKLLSHANWFMAMPVPIVNTGCGPRSELANIGKIDKLIKQFCADLRDHSGSCQHDSERLSAAHQSTHLLLLLQQC
jgi:hypothetical protein